MSASSEIVDSGRFSGHKMPEKTNFSQTFTLLNQYLKENGSFGDLNLGMAKSASATMNLFPAAEKSPADGVSKQQVSKKLPESAQMTIFYAGQVIVLNDFPADKAMEIMTLAGKGTYQPASSLAASQHKNIDKEGLQLHRPQPVVSDLPIARKASLTRFLEKRKERITARAPYQSEKQDEGKAWLGLAATQSGTQS